MKLSSFDGGLQSLKLDSTTRRPDVASTLVQSIKPNPSKFLQDAFSGGSSASAPAPPFMPGSGLDALPPAVRALAGPVDFIAKMTGLLPPDPFNFDLSQAVGRNEFTKQLSQFLNAAKPMLTGVGSSSQPASSAPTGSTSQPPSPTTSSTPSSSTAGGEGGPWGWTGKPPESKDYGDQSVIANADKFHEAQFKYQQAMSRMNEYWTMLSNIDKARSETTKAFIGNLR